MLASEIQGRKNKKALITLVVLLILTVASAFLVQTDSRPGVDKSVFKKVDMETVNKIRIESRQDTVELSFTNSRWRVNNAYPADRNLITLFFATLKQAEAKREITETLADSISRAIDQDGFRVTLFSDDQAIQTFVTAGNNSKTQSFFKDPVSGKVYLMSIPGYRVYVSGIFELKTGGWRDKMVFGTFNWRNFQSLEAQFPEKPGENFKVVAEGTGLFGIPGIKTDTAKLNTFLDDVSLITVEEYVESTSLRDSLTQVKPFLNLIVNDITGKQHSLKVYRQTKNGVLGIWMDNEAVLFNPQSVREIIRPKSFFVQK